MQTEVPSLPPELRHRDNGRIVLPEGVSSVGRPLRMVYRSRRPNRHLGGTAAAVRYTLQG